jgi:tRNA pseudouridine32 synthase/23S rRNA pseudouridine746 synthase
MRQRLEKHIRASAAGFTAIELLAGQTRLSRQQLKTAMTNGAVWLETRHGIRRIRRAKKIVQTGGHLHLYYDSEIQSQQPGQAELVADEGEYSVWNKPAGMYSQGSKWGDHCSIVRWAEKHLEPGRSASLVHRLDRAASGLILLAHSKQAARAFSSMFERRLISKHYRALVEGDMSRLELPCTINTPVQHKAAESIITKADYNPDEHTTRLVIDLKTGRKHQIRRQLSAAGHPLVGDRLYGSGNIVRDLQLKAVYLGFECPLTGVTRHYSLD